MWCEFYNNGANGLRYMAKNGFGHLFYECMPLTYWTICYCTSLWQHGLLQKMLKCIPVNWNTCIEASQNGKNHGIEM